MAKYCFYCGQELAPGEKCKCRTASGNASPKDSTRRDKRADSRKAGEKASTNHSKAAPEPGPRVRRNRKDRPLRRGFRFGTLADQLRTIFPTFTSGVMSSAGYIMRPATKIRQESLRAKRPFSLVTVAVFSLLTGLLGVLLVYANSFLFTGMMESIFGEKAVEYCRKYPAPAFGVLALVTLIFIMLLTLGFFATSRFGNRKPTFRKTLDLISVSLVYMLIPEFILLFMVLLGSSSSIAFLFIGLILMGLAQILAFRNALGLSEDSIFLMMISVYTVTYLVSKLLVLLLVSLIFPT